MLRRKELVAGVVELFGGGDGGFLFHGGGGVVCGDDGHDVVDEFLGGVAIGMGGIDGGDL